MNESILAWRRIFTVTTICVGVLALLLVSPLAAEAKKSKLKPPKAFSYNQDIETQKINVGFNKVSKAKKTVIKLRKGTTVLATKKVRKKRASFSEGLFVHGQKYNFRYRHAKTKTRLASNWRKKTFTFQDEDHDNDGLPNDSDPDDDNDGILDEDDDYPLDHDNDGIEDYNDDDDDNDLINDDDDDYPKDHDNDGIDDINDDDDDGDGIPDDEEEAGQVYDEDNDGTPDQEDEDYENYPNPEIITISITDDGFSDGELTINEGDYVKWLNQDTIAGHTIAAKDGSWTSQPLTYGRSYTKQFTSTGTYEYWDPVFQTNAFSGTIIVE